MAIAHPLAAAAAAFCAAWVFFSDDLSPHGTILRLARRLVWAIQGTVHRIAQTGFTDSLLTVDDASLAARDLLAALSEAGFVLTLRESVVWLFIISLLASALGAILASSWLGAVVGAGSYCLALHVHAARARQERARALSSEMPAVFRSLAVSLGSGLTLSQSIAYVGSREDGIAAPAFARCSLRLVCGEPYEEALEGLVSDLDTPGIGLLSTALAISHQTGSPLQGLFMRSARLVERSGELERLLAVKTAQVRLSVRIVCLLPAIIVGILLVISPDFQTGITTPIGFGSLVIACCMDAAAVLIVRHLSRGII